MVITTFVETLDGSWIYCYTSCILGRAPRTNETLADFVKIWIPINGTQHLGIRLPEIHRNSTGIPQVDELSTGPPGFGASHILFVSLSYSGF